MIIKFLWVLIPILCFSAGYVSKRGGDKNPIIILKALPVESEETKPFSLVAEVEQRSSEAFRRLMENGRINQSNALEIWAEADPAACHAWIMKQPHWHPIALNTGSWSYQADPLLGKLYIAWADRDPRAALIAIRDAPINANMGVCGILWYRLKLDPMGTIPLFAEFGGDASRMSFGNREWVKGNPLELLEQIIRLPESHNKEYLFAHAVGALAERDPASAFSWIAKEARPGGNSMEELFAGWARQNSAEALEYLRTKATANERLKGASPVIMEITKTDPSRAWEIAQELNVPTTAGRSVLSAWKSQDCEAAANAVAAIQDPQKREQLWSAMATYSSWKQPDIEIWLSRLPPDEQKDFLGLTMRRWAGERFSEAFDFVSKVPAQMLSKETVEAIAREAVWKSPIEQCLSWITSLPEPFQDKAVTIIFHGASHRKNLSQIEAARSQLPTESLKKLAGEAMAK